MDNLICIKFSSIYIYIYSPWNRRKITLWKYPPSPIKLYHFRILFCMFRHFVLHANALILTINSNALCAIRLLQSSCLYHFLCKWIRRHKQKFDCVIQVSSCRRLWQPEAKKFAYIRLLRFKIFKITLKITLDYWIEKNYIINNFNYIHIYIYMKINVCL
jgi:hypothetical protein